jgi:hypothetical protein
MADAVAIIVNRKDGLKDITAPQKKHMVKIHEENTRLHRDKISLTNVNT